MEKSTARSPIVSFLSRNAHIIIPIILALIVLGIFILCGGLAYLLIARGRAVTLPAPTGPYAVGRTIISWKDARPDLLAEGEPRGREYVVFLWYPAAKERAAQPAPYLPGDWVRAGINVQGLGALFRQDPGRVKSHAVQDAPLAESPSAFPVLIFEPGYGPIAPDYTTLAEDLASHGYVVAGITPVESAPYVVMPDGQVITRTAGGTLPEIASAAATTQAADRLILTWISDMRSTWTELNAVNRAPGPWQGRLDMARSGFFGHSFGGAAAVNTCSAQVECLAAADLDGTLYGPVAETGLTKPSLFIWAQGGGDPAVKRLAASAPAEVTEKALSGARHFNFTDQSMQFAPLLRLSGMLGHANPTATLQTVRANLLTFFDKQLK